MFEASKTWTEAYGSKGCSMVNAHAEISDPAHPTYAVIARQKEWMLALFAKLSGDDELARTLMLLHEGALVAHGLRVLLGA